MGRFGCLQKSGRRGRFKTGKRMKKANKYTIKITYSDGHLFHADILAVSAEAVSTWLPRNEEKVFVTSVVISLVSTGYQVQDNFCAADITNQTEANIYRFAR